MSEVETPAPVAYEFLDFLTLSRDLRANRAWWRKATEWMIVVMLLAGVLSLFLVGGPIGWDVWPGLIILFVVFVILPRPSVQARIIGWNYRRNPMKGEQQFRASDEGFGIDSVHGRSIMRWASLHAIRERDRVLLIYMSPKCAYMIPSRAFSNDEAFRRFADRVEGRLAVGKADPAT